jgi:hypothetical protein
VTVSFSKSISVLHASLRENERRARLAADQEAAAYWTAREQAFQEILHRANRAALEYLQAWAGVTRTGYHGTRVDGREPGRFEAARADRHILAAGHQPRRRPPRPRAQPDRPDHPDLQ